MNADNGPALHMIMTGNTAWNILNFRMPLVRALLAKGHKVTILGPADGAEAQLEAAGCRFMPLDMNVKGLSPRDDHALMRRFRRIFTAERPDLVLSYTIKNNIFGAMAARRLGIPFLPNVTGLGTAFLSGGLLQRVAEMLYRRAFARVPCVFFQNEEDRDLFLARRLVRPEQVRLLPGSGVDLEYFVPAPVPTETSEARPSFLMIARLLRDKGVVEYVEAARIIRARRPDIRFRLLGAVGVENRSAIGPETLAEWQEEGVIDYLGTTSDDRPVVREADCIVPPSYREGAPRTLIEAGAMARPAITTDVPGCRSVVESGVTGFLCEARDAQSLAAALERFLLLPPQDGKAMGSAARDSMERIYDQAHVVTACAAEISRATGRAVI